MRLQNTSQYPDAEVRELVTIVVNDWREALVAVAAHEARHHYQFAHNKSRSEVDCERHAAKILERFRRAA